MSIDFRTNALQANKIIGSGDNGTDAKIIVYPINAEKTPVNQGNIDLTKFVTGSIGSDIFMYVSGAVGSAGTSGSYGATVLGGDLVISGNLVGQGNVLGSFLSSDLPLVANFANFGSSAKLAQGDHVHPLPDGLAISDQTVFSVSNWSVTSAIPAESCDGTFPGGDVATITISHANNSYNYSIVGTEKSPRIERALIGGGQLGTKIVLRTRLVSFSGTPSALGHVGAGFYIRNGDDSGIDYVAHQHDTDQVLYGTQAGAVGQTALVVPWDGTAWLELTITDGTTLTSAVLVGNTRTVIYTRTIAYQPTHYGVFGISERSTTFSANFDKPQEILLCRPTSVGLNVLTAIDQSSARSALGIAYPTTWIDGGGKLKISASVAITSDNTYADAHGTDINFYVSDGSGKKAVFANDLLVSGNVINVGDYGDVKKATTTTLDDTPTLIWQASLSSGQLQTVDVVVLAKGVDGVDKGKWRREFVAYNNAGTVSLLGVIAAPTPDYNSNGVWGMNAVVSTTFVKVYVTGSIGTTVDWVSRATVVAD